MTRITPKIPLGPYPQPALCGQVGKAPIRIKINSINKIVLNILHLPRKIIEKAEDINQPIYHYKLIFNFRQSR